MTLTEKAYREYQEERRNKLIRAWTTFENYERADKLEEQWRILALRSVVANDDGRASLFLGIKK